MRKLPFACVKLCTLFIVLLCHLFTPIYAQLPPGFVQKRLTGDIINEATSLVHAPDGRIFMAERQSGITGYEVERSADGATFSTIALVLANSPENTSYQYEDNPPVSGFTTFYRIKVIEPGNTTHSRIATVRDANSAKTAKLYPQPAANTLTLEMNLAQLLNTDALL